MSDRQKEIYYRENVGRGSLLPEMRQQRQACSLCRYGWAEILYLQRMWKKIFYPRRRMIGAEKARAWRWHHALFLFSMAYIIPRHVSGIPPFLNRPVISSSNSLISFSSLSDNFLRIFMELRRLFAPLIFS